MKIKNKKKKMFLFIIHKKDYAERKPSNKYFEYKFV